MPADGGDAVDLMSGMDADTPSKPFGGPEEITFTPDGNGFVFLKGILIFKVKEILGLFSEKIQLGRFFWECDERFSISTNRRKMAGILGARWHISCGRFFIQA